MFVRNSVPAVLLALSLTGILVGCSAEAGSTADQSPAPSAVESSSPAVEAKEAEPTDSTAATASTGVDIPVAAEAQVQYVLTYWQDYNTAEYGTLGDNDCVNFTSQALLLRGWAQTDDWYYGDDGVYSSSDAWRSSTAFMEYLSEHPELATALDDTQRDQVVPGDIVQFDWDNSGDRDHTGTVTKVEKQADGTVKISFAGHTTDSDYRDVDQAITVDHPGGSVYYWHLA